MSKNTKSYKKIKEVGATINPSGVYYAKSSNRAYVRDIDGKPVYISAKKAGGEKEMFYAAAGIRNYISRKGKRPDKEALVQIITRAKNAEKAKHIWEKKYINKDGMPKRHKNPFRTPKADVTLKQTEIDFEAPKLSEIGTPKPSLTTNPRNKRGPEKFETTLKKSIDNGIITKRSSVLSKKSGKHRAEAKIKELNLDIDPRYLTYVETDTNNQVIIRITTKFGLQRVNLSSKKTKDPVNLFMMADSIRRDILRTGKIQDEKKAIAQKGQLLEKSKPIPSEINPPQKKEDGTWADVTINEQQFKSKNNTTFFNKIRMWIFG